MKRILINASNLHNGGGVQVAASFIYELANMVTRLHPCEIFIYVSSVVDTNLNSTNFNRKIFKNYHIIDIHGINSINKLNKIKFNGFDLVFTIFGPLYLIKSIPNNISGFAQPWIIYPKNDVGKKLLLKSRLALRMKFLIQWWFFKKADRLVVELQHVKSRLVSLKKYPIDRINVVSNCISAIYADSECWLPIPSLNSADKSCIKLGYVTRDYPHKNVDFLFEVARELQNISNIKYRFFVTLTDHEWSNHSLELKEYLTNIGPLNVAQCPTFYDAMDAVMFPSLLECFSATPLEAMAMKRPLFASDRGFVRDCCGENAIYFDPLDAKNAAKKIDDWFSQKDADHRTNHIDRAYRHVMSLPNSKDRAKAYIDIINTQLIS